MADSDGDACLQFCVDSTCFTGCTTDDDCCKDFTCTNEVSERDAGMGVEGTELTGVYWQTCVFVPPQNPM